MTQQTKKQVNKELRLKNAISVLENAVKGGFQGNITFPIRDGEIGMAKLEQFVDLESQFQLLIEKGV
ncbi:MAG: hypothetical protein QXY90_07065 [Candidatus Anstonellales archaeon]